MSATLPMTHPVARLADDERVALMRNVDRWGMLPYFREAESTVAPVVTVDGAERIMLASANYLGLADHPDVVGGARDAIDRYGSTITGSRLLNGTLRLHIELEEELADWTGREAALVFTTGYQANLGAISALLGHCDTAVVDSADHASLLDGCKLSEAKTRAFSHNRIELLEEALGKARDDGGAILVVVDGLYSMSGDLAALDRIVPLCREYGAGLMVDEAHAVGVLGESGTGTSELYDLAPDVDVYMGSLSKALGATGGFIAGSRDLIDALRVKARSFLFTTAGVPATLGAALAAVRLRRGAEGAERAAATLANSRYLRNGLAVAGLDVPDPVDLPEGEDIVSPIVPVRVGDDLVAVAWWKALFDRGVFTSAAMHPAVPPSGAMLRLCVMATHTHEQLDQAIEGFAAVKEGSVK